jgi:hypothetical protein
MEGSVEYKAEWMGRVGSILDEYDEDYVDIGDMEKMNRLYPGYLEMSADALKSEVGILRRNADDAVETGEWEDIDEELWYASRLLKKKVQRDDTTKFYLSTTHETLKEEIKTLLVLGRIAKGSERRRDYASKIGQIAGIIKDQGFDPNEAWDELHAENEGERLAEEAARKYREAEAERGRSALEAARKYREAEAERGRSALEAAGKYREGLAEDDTDKTEYWKKKLEKHDMEKLKPEVARNPEKSDRGKPKEPDIVKKSGKPYRGKEPKRSRLEEREKSKKPDMGKKPEKLVPGVDPEWARDTYTFENILFQVTEDAIPIEDMPVFTDDSRKVILKDIREDLNRHERFKSWVVNNFGFIIPAVLVPVAALITAVIIQTRKLASKASKGGPATFQLPDIVRMPGYVSSNLWVIAAGSGLVLLYNLS